MAAPEGKPATASGGQALVHALGLQFAPAPGALSAGVSFDIPPGLSLVTGDEGSGKSVLLRLLAGELAPTAGLLRRPAGACFYAEVTDPQLDAVPASAWLQAQQARHPAWHAGVASALAQALDLGEHLHKPMHMLSAGSRRKLCLLGAAASRAPLCLLDTPYAALDARSCRVLNQLLAEAAESTEQAWVVADYERPAVWAGLKLAALIDLGSP